MFIFEFDHLDWLSRFYSEWKHTSKLVTFQDFCWGPGMWFLVKFWKWLKFLNSVPIFKRTLANQVYIRIWSFWLTFTVLQEMKKNSKISQFSCFLLMSGYAILVKIWQWLKFLFSSPFIKKTLVNHFYIWARSFWLTFTALQLMKTNLEISRFEEFC